MIEEGATKCRWMTNGLAMLLVSGATVAPEAYSQALEWDTVAD